MATPLREGSRLKFEHIHKSIWFLFLWNFRIIISLNGYLHVGSLFCLIFSVTDMHCWSLEDIICCLLLTNMHHSGRLSEPRHSIYFTDKFQNINYYWTRSGCTRHEHLVQYQIFSFKNQIVLTLCTQPFWFHSYSYLI